VLVLCKELQFKMELQYGVELKYRAVKRSMHGPCIFASLFQSLSILT
jgi:hypothetical protein